MIEPWKQEIKDEWKHIELKIDSLQKYINSDEYDKQHKNEQGRIDSQIAAMLKYRDKLQERMTAWRYPEQAVKL